mgnify:FL=1
MKRYVALDGVDGSGKDTQAVLLVDRLRAEGIDVHVAREPDEANPVGVLLRSLLQSGRHAESHAALFVADRLASSPLRRRVLDAGRTIVQVRSLLSTLVYQSRRWPREQLLRMHDGLDLVPDVIVVPVVPVEAAQGHIGARGTPLEVYETGGWLAETRAKYRETEPVLRLGAKYDVLVPVVIVDGTGTAEEVHARVWEVVCG